MRKLKSLVLSVVSGAAVVVLATSCSSPTENPSDPGSGEGVPLYVSEFAYTIPAVVNAMLAQIADENPDLGVSEIISVPVDQSAAWAGAAQGDIDLLTEVALPNNQDALDENAETMTKATQIYGPAEQGWYVPKYAVSPGGDAEGLKSVTQLNDFTDVFGGKIISGDPAWKATEYDNLRMEGYDLDYQLIESADVARMSEMDKLYNSEKPFIIYLYHPSWVFAEYDLVLLEEAAPFSVECFADGGSKACGHPDYTSWVMARKDVQDRAPKFWEVLQRFTISMDAIEDIENEVDIKKRPVSEVVPEWMANNQDTVNTWING